MTIQLTQQAFHLRPFTECKRLSAPQWEKYQPLRWALCRQVLDGTLDGWEKLRTHPIIGIRAGFELG